MAQRGRVLENANVRLEFVRTTADTGGASVEVLATYRPGSLPPPLHYHPSQEEVFEVHKGALIFELDGVRRRVGAGESIVVPPRGVHRAWNPETDATEALWITRPALQTERFFETVYGLARDGRTDAQGKPSLLHVALIAREFSREWVLARPGPVVQSCVFGLLAPIAHACGVHRHLEAARRPIDETSGG